MDGRDIRTRYAFIYIYIYIYIYKGMRRFLLKKEIFKNQ
jgi:hypothetical protein